MKTKSQQPTIFGRIGILGTFLCVASVTHAATKTWDGGRRPANFLQTEIN